MSGSFSGLKKLFGATASLMSHQIRGMLFSTLEDILRMFQIYKVEKISALLFKFYNRFHRKFLFRKEMITEKITNIMNLYFEENLFCLSAYFRQILLHLYDFDLGLMNGNPENQHWKIGQIVLIQWFRYWLPLCPSVN